MRHGVDAHGRDSSTIQVVGALPVVTRGDGALDFDRTMEAVPALVAAGVTDFWAVLPLPPNASEAFEFLSRLITSFRATA